MEKLGFFPNSYTTACFESMSVELRQTGTFEGCSTYSNNLIFRPDTAVKKVTTTLTELSPCTRYRVDVESVSVDDDHRISAVPTSVDVVTTHAQLIDVIPFPEHEEIAFAVLLDGTDCLSTYFLNLCHVFRPTLETRTCFNRTVDKTGNVTFDGLTHDTTYSYQLIGVDEDLKPVFTSPELRLDTRPRVSGTFVVKGVTESEIKLEVVLSEFDAKKKRYSVHVEVVCTDGGDDHDQKAVTKTSDTVEKLGFAFNELEPNTIYECRGTLVFDKVESPIPKISVETLDGVPDKPENLVALVKEPERLELGWETPVVARGLVQEYLVELFPKFDKSKMASDAICAGEVRHEKEFGVVSFGGNVSHAWLEKLVPATTYDVTIRAKTRHKEAGKSFGLIDIVFVPKDKLPIFTTNGFKGI